MIREALLGQGETRLHTKLEGGQSLRVGDVLTVLGQEGDWEVLELYAEPVPERFTGRRLWRVDI